MFDKNPSTTTQATMFDTRPKPWVNDTDLAITAMFYDIILINLNGIYQLSYSFIIWTRSF